MCFKLCGSQTIQRNEIEVSVIDPRPYENVFHDEVDISDQLVKGRLFNKWC